MVNSSATMADATLDVPAQDERSLSFSEVLASSPPPTLPNTRFSRDTNDVSGTDQTAARRQSSRAGLLGRFANSKLRASVLRRDGNHDRRSIRSSLLTNPVDRQGSIKTTATTVRASATLPTDSARADDGREQVSRRISVAVPSKERLPRMATDPPPLGSAYSQAVKHGPLMAPSGSVEALLRTRKTHVQHAKKSDLDLPASNKRPATPNGSDTYASKIFVLTSIGYLLQYAGEGNYDRMPEKIMQLTANSAAMASDAIPGKHWVLHIQAAFEDEAISNARPRFTLNKLVFGGQKSATQNFLLIMDSVDELDAWLVAVRREIQSLGGAEYQSDFTERKNVEVGTETQAESAQSALHQPIPSSQPKPVLNRTTSAPEQVVRHRITSSMATQGLLLRMDDTDAGNDPGFTAASPNHQGALHGHTGVTSPVSQSSISEKIPHDQRSATDSTTARNAPTGRRQSQSQTLAGLQANSNEHDHIIEESHSRPSGPTAESLPVKPTGLRRKEVAIRVQSTSPVIDPPHSGTTQSNQSSLAPLSAGFKRLSPLIDAGPFVLTPPESPEPNPRPRSMSMLDIESATQLSSQSAPLQSPVSDPGLSSPVKMTTDHISPKSIEPARRKSSIALQAPPTRPNDATSDRKDSVSTTDGDHEVTRPAAWIPPRHSSLMYSAGNLPGSGPSSGRSTPPSGSSERASPSKVGSGLKNRLAALDISSLPVTNALLLAPSPHPPPTMALPELPKDKSPAASRPSSRLDQIRKASVASTVSERSASITSSRKPSDAGSTHITEPPSKQDDTPVEQVTPRKARVQKVILPPMSQVSALHPDESSRSSAGVARLTVAERRRHRSPSPVNARGRSNSHAEKVLSAISEMTEASMEPSARSALITIGIETSRDRSDSGPVRKVENHPGPHLLPNGMPNPLAANPTTTPDLRMIPLPPMREPPAIPESPLEYGAPVVLAPSREGTGRPLARRPSILDRAKAALEAAKAARESKHSHSSSRDDMKQTVLRGPEPKHSHETRRTDARSGPLDERNAQSALEQTAPHYQAPRSLPKPHQKEVKVHTIEHSEREVPPQETEDAAPLGRDGPTPSEPIPELTEESEELEETEAKISTPETKSTQVDAIVPLSLAVQSPFSGGLPSNPQISPKTLAQLPARPRHIAEVMAVPELEIAELPCEPVTPPMPKPVMKASITGFGQDEFDMWAWPVDADFGGAAGTEGLSPNSNDPPFAPLKLDLEIDSQGAACTRASQLGNEATKGRWSLFGAIEGIE